MKKIFIFSFLILLLGIAIYENPVDAKSANTALTQNESNYLNISNVMWRFWSEDMNYSSKILNEYVKKNISTRDALEETVSVFTLNYQTTKMISLIKPPIKYAEYHNNTIKAMIAFQSYLLDMAKFYETGDKRYTSSAKSSFDESTNYHDRAILERMP